MFDNAVAAMAAMAKLRNPTSGAEGSVLAATMFGVTTSGVSRVRQRLEELGHEVWTFHASGYGGRTMDLFVTDGRFLESLTSPPPSSRTSLAAGWFSGPRRMEAAVAAGLPQVISTGASTWWNLGRSFGPGAFRQATSATAQCQRDPHADRSSRMRRARQAARRQVERHNGACHNLHPQ